MCMSIVILPRPSFFSPLSSAAFEYPKGWKSEQPSKVWGVQAGFLQAVPGCVLGGQVGGWAVPCVAGMRV